MFVELVANKACLVLGYLMGSPWVSPTDAGIELPQIQDLLDWAKKHMLPLRGLFLRLGKAKCPSFARFLGRSLPVIVFLLSPWRFAYDLPSFCVLSEQPDEQRSQEESKSETP